MWRIFLFLLSLAPALAQASVHPLELHQRLALASTPGENVVALTLDACGGAFDAGLVRFLVERRIPATVFATRKWLDRNPEGTAVLKRHADLFDIEDHGANHVPAVIGAGRRIYGIAGNPDGSRAGIAERPLSTIPRRSRTSRPWATASRGSR